MQSDRAKEIVEQAFSRASARDRGLPRRVIGLSGMRMRDLQLEDSTRLPIVERTQELQNASGQFYFIAGYSKVNGPDVVA